MGELHVSAQTSERTQPLLERSVELAAVQSALSQAAAGAGGLLLVEGPAGIGKTRLIAEAIALARPRRFLIQVARGGELEREVPFGMARQLLEPIVERSSDEDRDRLLHGSAALALAALGRADPGRAARDPFAPIHGLYWLLANLADPQPVLLVVDDLHWADPQTLRFLDYLTRRLGGLPVLVVGGLRSGEPDEPVELERLRLHSELIRPRALSELAVRELLTEQLGAVPSPDLAQSCAQATAGNPFLVAELLRSLRMEAIQVSDAATMIAKLGPESVARYALLRLGRFGGEAIALARAIAVLGGAPQLRHAARLADVEESRAAALCDRFREAEIIGSGLPISFVHPLVRQAIYSELSEGERSRLHRQAAELLGAAGSAAREVAPHLMACVPNGNQWVVTQLLEAAWDAMTAGAFDAAEVYLERALQEPAEDEQALTYALGRCMLQTNPARASDILRALADGTSDTTMRARALRHAANGYFVARRWSEAAACYDDLLELLPHDDREQRLVVEAELYLTRMPSSGRSASISRRIRSVADGLTATTAGERLARQALALDLFLDCAPVARVVELAAAFPPHPWEIRTNVPPALARILAWSGRDEEARRALTSLRDTARRLGMMINEVYYSSVLSHADRLGSRLVDSEAEARTALEIARATTVGLNPWMEALVNLLATLIARGDLDEAQRWAQGIDLSDGMREIQVAPWPIEVRGYLRLATGDLQGGADDLLEFGEGAEEWRFLNPAIPWRQEVAPALAALGRTDEARNVITVAEERARAFGAPHVMGTVLRSKAMLERHDRGVATLHDSVDLLLGAGPPHELARSLIELGGALRRDGHRREAREPLRRALDLAHRCGAAGLARTAREELVATGARPRRAMITGRDALTATEQRVAAMAARGMSNPQIAQALYVSRKTVENHLGRIYMKLGIASRTELAEALAKSTSSPEQSTSN